MAISWLPETLVAFDVESTGVDVEADRIVTATLATIRMDQRGSEVRSTVIDPGVPVPEGAAAVHGWTTARVQAEGKPPASELDWIATDLATTLGAGIPVVAANAPYDLTILDRELRRHHLATVVDRLDGRPLAPVIDPMVLDKHLDRYRRGKKTLAALCETYGVRLDGAHDAAEDALAAARLVWRYAQLCGLPPSQLIRLYTEDPASPLGGDDPVLCGLSLPQLQARRIGWRRFPRELAEHYAGLGALGLAELHEAQVGWYAEQAGSFAGYLRKKARKLQLDQGVGDVQGEVDGLLRRAAEVSTDWPMMPYSEGES